MTEPIGTRIPEVPAPLQEAGPIQGEPQREGVTRVEQPIPEPQPVEAIPLPHLDPAPIVEAVTADPLIKDVELVMADGMEDAYLAMDAPTQERFKIAGEVAAGKIARLLEQSKVQVKKIVGLILAWLRIIPKVNRFYLEQQSQIKAHAIMNLKHPPRPG